MARRKTTTSVRADAKLQNLPQAAHDELWALRHPEIETDRAWTYSDVAAWVPGRFHFEVSVSAVSTFYQWLTLKKRMDERAEAADQLKLDLAKNFSVSEETIVKAGQRLFLVEGVMSKDVRAFSEMVKIGQEDTKLKQKDAQLALQKKAGERDERRLAILEAKAAQADAASAVTNDAALSDEEKASRLKLIFRMG